MGVTREQLRYQLDMYCLCRQLQCPQDSRSLRTGKRNELSKNEVTRYSWQPAGQVVVVVAAMSMPPETTVPGQYDPK